MKNFLIKEVVQVKLPIKENWNIKASLAEWSNAMDLRPILFGGAGSNPARCNIILYV
jgi:hypothetical protein